MRTQRQGQHEQSTLQLLGRWAGKGPAPVFNQRPSWLCRGYLCGTMRRCFIAVLSQFLSSLDCQPPQVVKMDCWQQILQHLIFSLNLEQKQRSRPVVCAPNSSVSFSSNLFLALKFACGTETWMKSSILNIRHVPILLCSFLLGLFFSFFLWSLAIQSEPFCCQQWLYLKVC